jgi:DNA-binding XRE family transcriptional regulator
VCKHVGSPLLGAGSSLPFPLRRGEFRLTRRHGAGVTSARPHLCLRCQRSSFQTHILNRDPRQTPQPQPALGKAIRELRQKHGATQEELAPKAGITPKTLSLVERGEANPTWGTLRGIADALGVSMGELAKLADKLLAAEK